MNAENRFTKCNFTKFVFHRIKFHLRQLLWLIITWPFAATTTMLRMQDPNIQERRIEHEHYQQNGERRSKYKIIILFLNQRNF